MTLFLTSSPSGCPFEPGPAVPVLDRRNHFLENLRAVWPDHPVRGLAIAADPHAYAQNDEMCRVFLQSFADAHLPLTELVPCDARNAGRDRHPAAPQRLCDAVRRPCAHPEPLFCPAGPAGAVPQLPRHRAGRERRQHERRPAWCMPRPEEPGEAADPGYCRWLNGLGLTETRILPHYQFIREHILDGQKVEDIALADSRKAAFPRPAGRLLPDVLRRAAKHCTAKPGTLRTAPWRRSTRTRTFCRCDKKTKKKHASACFFFVYSGNLTKGAMALASPWRTME